MRRNSKLGALIFTGFLSMGVVISQGSQASSLTNPDMPVVKAWDTIKSSTNPDDFRKFLSTYAINAFSTYARNHLMHLTSNSALTHNDSAINSIYKTEVDGVWSFNVNWTFVDNPYCELADYRPLSLSGGILEGQLEHSNDTIPFDGHIDGNGKVKFIGAGIFAIIEAQGKFGAHQGAGKIHLTSPIASVDCYGDWKATRIVAN